MPSTPRRRDWFFYAQIVLALAVMAIGVYLAVFHKPTPMWSIGGIVAGIGISILPFPAAGFVGAVVCLGFAAAGYYFGRIPVLAAALVAVLSVVTIAERLRALSEARDRRDLDGGTGD